MSIVYNDTTNKSGIIQLIEQNCGFNDGGISGDTTLLAQFTGQVNTTIDEMLGFLFPKGGTWQLDDSNHIDHPFIFTNLVSGQRDYSFDTDEQGNVVLDIYRVMVADSGGTYHEIKARDQQTLNSNNSDTTSYIDGKNTSGTPNTYDKTGSSIFLDPVPNYNYTKGLKVFINREGSYFTTSDTTKKLGFASLFHEYLALKPSYNYARANSLTNREVLKRDMLEMRQAIIDYYGTREKDVKKRFLANVENCK